MISTNMLYFLFAGILIVSLLFLTPPWTVTNLVLGITPLIFLLVILIFVIVEKRRQKNKQDGRDSGA